MRILVTGGSGFIGSHAIEQLHDNGHTVGCLDINPPSPYVKPFASDLHKYRADVTDPIDVYDTINDFAPDRIIHLASLLGRESQQDPRRAFEINVMGTVHVLEAAETFGVERVVVASSASAYGTVPPEYDELTEAVPRDPDNIYGLSKFAVERLGRTYQEQDRVDFVAIEPIHGIGPDRRRGNIEDAYIVKAAVSGHSLTIPNIDYPIELIYVGDEANAFVTAALADDPSYTEYLIGTGDQYTLAEIAEIVKEHIPDADLPLGEPDEDAELLSRPPTNTTRIRTDLGWSPTRSIPDAIAGYIEWLENNPDSWSFDPNDVPWEN
jgi:nucleoside-diphosphate-sugar epimerase